MSLVNTGKISKLEAEDKTMLVNLLPKPYKNFLGYLNGFIAYYLATRRKNKVLTL